MRRLPQVAALALAVLAGCGGAKGSSTSVADAVAARKQVGDYLAAFYRGDGKAACSLLTATGQNGLRSESLSLKTPGCADTVSELSSTSRRLRSPRIQVVVKGNRATATIRATRPSYESGVLLEKSGGKWLIAYPPGLLQKYVGKGGVKPGARLQTPSD